MWSDNSQKKSFNTFTRLLLGQYKIHSDEEGVYGFRNWAFLDEEAEQNYMIKREIDFDDWNSGDRVWVIDTIFKRKHNEAMTFYKTFFAHLLGVGNLFNGSDLHQMD